MDDHTATIVNIGGTILLLIVPTVVIFILAKIIWESLDGERSGKRMMGRIAQREEEERQKRAAK